MDFLPVILTSMSEDERTMVVIHCSAEATPEALVLWIKNGEHLQTGSKYQISTNTTQLFIQDFNASSTDLDTYTCTATNPLGNTTVDTTLLGMDRPFLSFQISVPLKKSWYQSFLRPSNLQFKCFPE